MRMSVLLLLATACAATPWSHVSVRARTLQAGARDSTGISGVPNAVVSLVCPNAPSQELGRTDEEGRLQASPDLDLPLDCSIAVAQKGFRTQTVSVRENCVTQGKGVCRNLNLDATLSRTSDAQLAKDRSAGATTGN